MPKACATHDTEQQGANKLKEKEKQRREKCQRHKNNKRPQQCLMDAMKK